jgi:protein Tex
MKEYRCEVIAIGNGTACRETEQLVADAIVRELPDVRYVIVNEAGASIYSASPAGREEFPELDATVRGTISIGRRLLDPLSELVKIDPQHLGVGMYQHDLQEKRLRESLQDVIESCVNYVGVDLNRASATLLGNVSGFNQRIARGVVEWREEHGPFCSRLQLREVSGIGDSAFTQAAGFLRITDGEQPLDGTWIHPESYPAATRILQHVGLTPQQLLDPAGGGILADKLAALRVDVLAHELQIGRPTCADIIDALRRPGRDPRSDHPGPVFKQGILKLEDLVIGMELSGTVLNVVDFGAFVDVGLKSSGLVHISRLAAEYVRNPHDYVAVGDIVTVWVEAVDRDRGRVSLSMIPPAESEH